MERAPPMSATDTVDFLARLAPDGGFTFQTFDDTSAKRRSLNRILHGPLSEHASKLNRLNDQGAGIFIMVNRGNGNGRRGADVVSVRALFVDLDGAPIEPMQSDPLAPHIVVESSPGRFHAYWLVDGISLEAFRGAQKALAARFGGDPVVHDLPRVMRVPGFLHRKGAPFATRIMSLRPDAPYQRAQIMEAFDIEQLAQLPRSSNVPDVICEGDRNSMLFSLACSFRAKGFDRDQIHRRITKINIERCQPLLDAYEISSIADNASRYSSDGFAQIPHALYDSEAFERLSMPAKGLLFILYRRYNGSNNGNISAPHSDLKRHGIKDAATLAKYLQELLSTRVIEKTRPAVCGIPEVRRQCALYKLVFIR